MGFHGQQFTLLLERFTQIAVPPNVGLGDLIVFGPASGSRCLGNLLLLEDLADTEHPSPGAVLSRHRTGSDHCPAKVIVIQYNKPIEMQLVAGMRARGGEREMSLVIPDEILYTARMTAAELAQEIAILLYQREKLTLGQASRLAQMSQLQFQFLLASRQIPMHYDVAEFDADLKTLREMGRL